tara:strand:+ start:158 stop:319 length:162 start_codon:yes stop_codon:yes gene_type:complete
MSFEMAQAQYDAAEPPDDQYADLSDKEYEEMLDAIEVAESNYWDSRIDEARGN